MFWLRSSFMWTSSSVPGDLCFRTAARVSGLSLLSRAPLHSSCDFGGSLHHPGGRRQPVGPRCGGQKIQQWTQPATWHLHIEAPPPPRRGTGWLAELKLDFITRYRWDCGVGRLDLEAVVDITQQPASDIRCLCVNVHVEQSARSPPSNRYELRPALADCSSPLPPQLP